MKRMVLISFIVGITVIGLGLTAAGTDEASGGDHPTVASGIGSVMIGGREAHVEVYVSVAPGRDAADEVRSELIARGARPLSASEYATTGLVWNEFSDDEVTNDFVVQYYNAGSASTVSDPTNGGGETALLNTHNTWTNVPTSKLAFAYGGPTTRCPSLVQECAGDQIFDGLNDVAWLDLGRCSIFRCTLGVTWYATTDPDEADMALNTRVSWRTNGTDYDVETVMLHENGHALGLGHSSIVQSIMYASYNGIRRTLHQDDIDGVSALYPAGVGGGSTSTPTSTPQPTNTVGPSSTPTATPTASCPPGWRKQGRC